MNRSLRKIFILFCIIQLAALPMQAQQAVATLSRDTILIGDQVQLTLQFQGFLKGNNLIWAKIPDSLKGWEIVDTGKIDTVKNNGKVTLQQQFIITGFDSGRYTIPPFSFAYAVRVTGMDTLKTQPLTLTVNTLDADTTKAFKPIKDIVQVEQPGFLTKTVNYLKQHTYLILGIILLLVIVGLALYFLLRKRKQKNEPHKYETPYEKSLRMLKELEAQHLYEQGRIKEHYSQLSDIIREYLEKHLGINAMEQTTDDILRAAKRKTEARKIRPELKQLLQTADLAKFAKANPLHHEHQACFDAAFTILNKTKPEEKNINSAQ